MFDGMTWHNYGKPGDLENFTLSVDADGQGMLGFAV